MSQDREIDIPEDYAYANITTEEADELSHETDTHILTILPKIGIVIKTIVILAILIRTFVAWFRLKQEDIKKEAQAVRSLVLVQCAICMILLLASSTFDFIEHYTHYYLTLFVLASYVFYGTLYIILRLGAQELPDVAILLKKVNKMLIVFILLTAIVFIVGLIRHDLSALCVPHTYPPGINFAKIIVFAFNAI